MVKRVGSKSKSRKKKRGFVYKKRDPDSVKNRAEQRGGRFDSPFAQKFDTFRPKQGDNLIRFLPPTWDGHEYYGFDIWVHKFVGQENSNYLCLSKMKQEHCPICRIAKETRDAGEVDEAKALEASRQVLTWIIDRDSDDQMPILYPMSWTMDRDIAALCHNKRTGNVLFIDHPDEGYDVTIKRAGQGLNTRYFGMQIDRDSSTLHEDESKQEEILEFIKDNPLPSILNYYDASYLEKIMSGMEEERDEDLDDEEYDEDEYDEDDEELDEEEDDEDDEEYDEDDEEEEDDEDEDDEELEDDDEDYDEDEDEDEDDEEEDDEEEEDDDEELDEEEEDEDEDEYEDDEEEEEPEPAPRRKRKSTKKKAPVKRKATKKKATKKKATKKKAPVKRKTAKKKAPVKRKSTKKKATKKRARR